MQKYKKIVRGCKSNPGGAKSKNKKARRAKKPKATHPCPPAISARAFAFKPVTLRCLHKNKNL